MLFGLKPIYLFAQYNKKKFHSLGKSYSFDKIPVEASSCVLKMLNNKVEVFFSNTIFNSYVVSEEEFVYTLKSFDEKITVIKKTTEVQKGKLITFKIINEDENIREVEVYKFDEFFVGLKTTGVLDIKEGKPFVVTKYGSGECLLQGNVYPKDIECVLAKIEDSSYTFAQINSPIERASVKIVKDLNNIKIVENENIKGILINAKNRKLNEEVNVFVKNIYPGSYAFIEDIVPGLATVELINKMGNISQVKLGEFIGECRDKKVNKTMKGYISDIVGNKFKFKRISEEDEPKDFNESKRMKISDNKELRTDDYVPIKVKERKTIESEKDIVDQHSAIEFLRKSDEKDVSNLFKKYSKVFSENDHLCVFYISHLLLSCKKISESELGSVLKLGSKNLPKILSESTDNLDVLKYIFNKSKTSVGFKKILFLENQENIAFMKENPQFESIAINFIYKNFKEPRISVEKLLSNSKNCQSWIEYLKNEDGQYKRNLFRRMTKMAFNKNDMKNIFKLWIDFEDEDNVEEVHKLANEYVNGLEQKSKQ